MKDEGRRVRMKGQAFTVRIELHNTGVCPWIPGVGQELRFSGVAEQVRLPKTWTYEGEWVAPGESRAVELRAIAPESPSSGVLKIGFVSPFRVPEEFIEVETHVAWN